MPTTSSCRRPSLRLSFPGRGRPRHQVPYGTAHHQETLMAWLSLFVAGLLEIVWAFYMKQSHGFTRLLPSVITLVTMAASFALLSLSMRTLPLGTAYTIWT